MAGAPLHTRDHAAHVGVLHRIGRCAPCPGPTWVTPSGAAHPAQRGVAQWGGAMCCALRRAERSGAPAPPAFDPLWHFKPLLCILPPPQQKQTPFSFLPPFLCIPPPPRQKQTPFPFLCNLFVNPFLCIPPPPFNRGKLRSPQDAPGM
eukprot:365568-Chlamydomonas_euryale.AAC.2